MRISSLFLIGSLLLNPTRASAQTGFLDQAISYGGSEHRYQIYVPIEYTNAQAWPLIVFLHGAGARGTDGLRHTALAMPQEIRRHRSWFPTLVVFPQVESGQTWLFADSAEFVTTVVDQTMSQYRIDPARIYIAGHSMGANGGYRIAYRNPERYAAAVFTAGRIELTSPGYNLPEHVKLDQERHAFARASDPFAAFAERLRNLPIWIFHGDADETVPVDQSRRLAAALRASSAAVRYTEYPGGNHAASMERAWADSTVVSWLLSQRRE